MQSTTTAIILKSLLRADFTTQWRNRRSVILVLVIPVIILFSIKSAVENHFIPASFAIGNSITVGLMAIGLMGYTITIARDREKRIFQRLRVAPLPGWAIMTSRLTVQIAMIFALTVVVCIAGFNMFHVTYSIGGYLLVILAGLTGGAVYLGLGQIIVGLIRNPETVNSTTRLVYFIFIFTGMIGEMRGMGDLGKQIVDWTPYGTITRIVAGALNPAAWTMSTTYALLASLGYALVFFTIGIKKFQWESSR